MLIVITLILSVYNVVFSGSRVAIMGLVVILLTGLLVGLFISRYKFSFFLKFFKILAIFIPAGIYFFMDRAIFIIYRFEALIEQRGGERFEQLQSALTLLDSGYSWLFGVSKFYQQSVVPYTEMEPVFLLVNYGILGIVLRYGLLLATMLRSVPTPGSTTAR